jgi:hypothetical protein
MTANNKRFLSRTFQIWRVGFICYFYYDGTSWKNQN